MKVGLGLRGMIAGVVGLYVFLLFDVLLYDGQWCATHRADEVTICPECRDAAFNEGEILAQFTRAHAFYFFDETMDSVLRIYIHE